MQPKANWAYCASAGSGEGRDERLDLLRGFCLLKMVLSHLWPQPVDLQIAFGFVSAAEGFFLISGATTGIVFGRRAESRPRLLLLCGGNDAHPAVLPDSSSGLLGG